MELTNSIAKIEECLSDTDKWMSINRLKLNKDKTELLYLFSNIFRPLVFLRGTGAYKLRGSVPLSYTREIVLSAFDSIGLPKQDYGLHSLRAGGASAAANAGVPDRLFKRHGRWKSDKAKDGYIKDNVHSLVLVSLSLYERFSTFLCLLNHCYTSIV